METLLRNLRKKQQITLEELSERTGLSQSHLNRAELGQINISEKTAKILSDYYGTEIKPTNDVSARISEIIQKAYKRERRLTKSFEKEREDFERTLKAKDREIKLLKEQINDIKNIVRMFSKKVELRLSSELLEDTKTDIEDSGEKPEETSDMEKMFEMQHTKTMHEGQNQQ